MNHRGYLISTHPLSPNLYKVATEGQGGKIPNVLDGKFTSPTVAMEHIDNYLDTIKGRTNGKTTAKNGGQDS